MNIKLGICTDEKNKIQKTFTVMYEYEGHIKEPSSIIDPVILIQADLSSIAGVNYCYIPAFRRRYYINNIKSATNDTCTISCHVDVLASFVDDIMNCAGYVERNEDVVSHMLQDNVRERQVNPAISTVPFTVPNEGSGYTYCLVTTKYQSE